MGKGKTKRNKKKNQIIVQRVIPEFIQKLREDIEEFIDVAEDKKDLNSCKIRVKKIYRKYKNDLNNIEKYPDIFTDLYCNWMNLDLFYNFYTIDMLDCLPKTHYSSIEEIYKEACIDKPITLRNIYEYFYKDFDEILEYHVENELINPEELIKQLEKENKYY